MKTYDGLKLATLLAAWLATPTPGTACICSGPEGPVPDDEPVVVGTVLAVDLADNRWRVAVWPESVRDSSRCGEYVVFESDEDSCRGRLPEIGDRWAAASTVKGETLHFFQCSRRGLVDSESTQRWLAPLEASLHRCEAASTERVTAAAETAAKRFGTSDRTCEDSVSFQLFRLTGPRVFHEPSWGEDGQVAWFRLRPDGESGPPLPATVAISTEARLKCWTRACLVQEKVGAEPLVCTYLRPTAYGSTCATLPFAESEPSDFSEGGWVLRFTEVPTGPYWAGPAFPEETLVPERCR